jgi:type IV pilus assembly protein PilA
MTDMFKTVHKAPITAGKVGGTDGYLFDGPMKIGAVRVDSTLFVGPLAEVEAAVNAKGDLPAGIAQRINSPSVFGIFVGMEQLLNGMGGQMPAKDFETMKAMAKTAWDGMLVDGFLTTRWQVDGRGLKLGEGPAMMAMVGILAAVAIPAFMKYIRRSKTAEATMNLRKLFDSSVSYLHSEHATPEGKILPRHFPKSAPRTPATTACKDGEPIKHMPTPEMWNHPTWQALNFAIQDPFYYQYEYVSDAKGFTARAIGDLDCDGVLSTFERVGTFDAEGIVNGGAGVFKNNELE